MVFISIILKLQKGTPTMVTPYTKQFSFLQGVYPVGVTDLRPYFTRIIDHNSVNVHRIPTKVGTEIRLNEPFKCVKVQPDWSTSSYLGNGWTDCLQIWYVDSRNWSVVNLVPIG